jgi:uncharacterized NAD(P)/FAD-binding protein YdhS
VPNATKNHLDPALIAIVGGGFSGVATAIRLLSARVTVPRRVAIIESSSLLGRGTAYRTENDAHLLNVPAGRMNPLPGEPGRFLEWLRARMSDAGGGSFVPRRWFGAYLDESLRGAALGVVRGTALMGVERTALSVGALPVEYARDLYRADRVRLMVRTEVRR